MEGLRRHSTQNRCKGDPGLFHDICPCYQMGMGGPTFSESSPVSWSWQRCVKTMVKTAWERLLVSFMLVAATVLGEGSGH